MNKVLGLSEACLGVEEKNAAVAVIRSGWLSQGEKVAEFESLLGQNAGGLNAVAVSSCTAGLHMALAALGLQPADEVLVPGVTFIATVNAVLYAGAKPVPVDISSELPHMSLEAAKRACTPRTRAIMLMHYGGYRMDIAAWKNFAQSRGLALLEDAAHAPGLDGVGLSSHSAILSFFANKNMTTGEGGMILTRDGDLAARLKRMRGHGMTSGTLSRARGHAWSYDVDMPGWNYRMDEIRAAIGIEQLKKLPLHNRRRKELTDRYRKKLAELAPWIKVPFDKNWPTVAHIMPILLPAGLDRQSVMAKLREARIQTSIHYPMYHRFTWHTKYFGDIHLPNTEDWASRTLTLPLHPGIEEDDVDYVVHTLASLGCQL